MKKNSVTPTPTPSPTAQYSNFTAQVDAEVSLLIKNGAFNKRMVHTLLNGAAAKALEDHVARETRSADGIFFSGKALARYVAARLSKRLKAGASIADPACGAGDLLLGCAAHFKMESHVSAEVSAWSNRIVGLDLHDAFIDACRSRLTLLALSRFQADSSTGNNVISSAIFSNIQQGNYFENIIKIAEVDCVVMNPPFASAIAPDGCTWATGNVQLAGLFVTAVLENAKEGQEIVAVLPDVLRSGTRYKRWREVVAKNSDIKEVFVYGRFDEKTDVDVFVIHLVKNSQKLKKNCSDWERKTSTKKKKYPTVPKMEKIFKVSVGAYVPFRAKKEAKEVFYIKVNDATPDGRVEASGKCRFDGTLHKAPFVVIRRTSNPSDARRVIPTLVTGPDEMAVENHLIVLRPLDGTLKSCEQLLQCLGHSDIDKWMNEAIRCRHLTTEKVKQLPLTGWK